MTAPSYPAPPTLSMTTPSSPSSVVHATPQGVFYPPPMGLPAFHLGLPATFGQRLVARILDGLLMLAVVVALYIVLFVSFAVFQSPEGVLVALLLGPLVIMFASTLVGLLYFQISETSGGRSAGRAAMGIRLVNVNPGPGRTDKVGGWQAMGRRCIQGLGDLVFGLGSLSMLWDAQRRTWADHAGGTAVVQSRAGSSPARSLKVAGFVTAGFAVLLVVGVGAASAISPSDNNPYGESSTPYDTGSSDPSTPYEEPTADDEPTIDPSLSSPLDLAASVEAQAPDGVDDAGNTTSYGATNLVDGDPETAWRVLGDGSGQSITVTWSGTSTITSVGLINGYAKTDPSSGVRRYGQGRTINQVTWTFDDGTELTQTLSASDESVQWLVLPTPVSSSSTVTLHVDATNEPGDADFDYTAISEIQVEGQ